LKRKTQQTQRRFDDFEDEEEIFFFEKKKSRSWRFQRSPVTSVLKRKLNKLKGFNMLHNLKYSLLSFKNTNLVQYIN